VERTVRAVTHAKATLMAGFTTVRDLGTEGESFLPLFSPLSFNLTTHSPSWLSSEGALDADVHLRASLSPPLSLSPSPRIFVSTRAIVSTGSYGPRTQKW